MRKSAKVSLALALMMGVVGGAQIANMNTASAEISDKFRMEMNGVVSYRNVNDDNVDSYRPSTTRSGMTDKYWSNYYRLVVNYYQDKNVSAQFRLHSGYDTVGDYVKNTNTTGMKMDRAYVQFKDPVAKTTYMLGRQGQYMGQGMVFNSTGNHTGVTVQIGNWWEPNNVSLHWWDNDSGKREHAINAHVGVAKNVKMSALYFDADTGHTPNKFGDLYKSHILSFGAEAKMPGITLVGECAHNLDGSNNSYGKSKMSGDRKAWYLEAYTGPTTDMTSGLPLQKPGTNVWSLKYQDIGKYSTVAHNPTFVDNQRGFRLTYGHTFRKGLAADIAWGRYKDKFTNKSKNSWDNIIVGEVSFKFK